MTDHFAEAESYLQKLDTLDVADAYVAVVAAQAHAQLAQIEEPEEFASVVKARDILAATYKTGLFWTRVTGSWMDDVAGCERQWDQLEVVEVLRVGLGEPQRDGFCTCFSSTERALDCGIAEHRRAARIRRDPMDDSDEPDTFNEGMREMNTAIHQKIRALLADAITGERRNAFEKAIQAVEELAP